MPDQRLRDSVLRTVAKQQANERFFIYKDLEEIMAAFGFVDGQKPKNSKNLNFDVLD